PAAAPWPGGAGPAPHGEPRPGRGRPGRGMPRPKPTGGRGAVVRAQHVVLLALDLADQQPADVLIGRPLHGAVVARARERHVRQDTLIYDALDPAALARTPLRDHRRAIN